MNTTSMISSVFPTEFPLFLTCSARTELIIIIIILLLLQRLNVFHRILSEVITCLSDVKKITICISELLFTVNFKIYFSKANISD